MLRDQKASQYVVLLQIFISVKRHREINSYYIFRDMINHPVNVDLNSGAKYVKQATVLTAMMTLLRC
jgi:hypothetical protein